MWFSQENEHSSRQKDYQSPSCQGPQSINTRLDFTFPKSRRLLTKGAYRRVLREGKRAAGQWLVVCFCPNTKKEPRLGLTVSTRFGKSHQRNRFKRLVREAFRQIWGELPSIDLNIKPRSKAIDATAADIQQELKKLLN